MINEPYTRPWDRPQRSKIYESVVKMAGEEREPHPEDHPSSPEQKLRPRAEVILYTKDGVWGIKKPTYLLLPGGGIPEGQRSDEAAIVEALEEADRLCHNLEGRAIVSTIYDKKYMSYKDWDGEITHFFIALDGGPGGMNHKDKEKFTVIPFAEAIEFLGATMNNPDNEWARENNQKRMIIIQEAERRARMDENGLTPTKYAYWREDLPRYLKRTGTYKALSSYIESLSGKNIVRAMNSEKAIEAKKETVKRLYNKELNKAFTTKAGPKITKLQDTAASSPRKGIMGGIDKVLKRTPDKAGAKAQSVAERSGAVNKERLRRLEDMKAKLSVTRPTSVVGEQMRTNDARFLTGTALIGGGIVGGNYLVNKSKTKPFTSDGPAYMMPQGFREPISVMSGIPPMPEIKQASYKGDINMDNETLQKIAEEAFAYGYNEEMEKLAVTAALTPEEQAKWTKLYHNNAMALANKASGNTGGNGLSVAAKNNWSIKYNPKTNITEAPKVVVEAVSKATSNDILGKGKSGEMPKAVNAVSTGAAADSAKKSIFQIIKEHPKTSIGLGLGAAGIAGYALSAGGSDERKK